VIATRRAGERRHVRRLARQVWRTFATQDRVDPWADGFSALASLDEDRLDPGATLNRQPGDDTDILTYVHEGSLAHADEQGHAGVLQAGEFQRRTASRGVRHRETNPSLVDDAHVFRIALYRTDPRHLPVQETRRFSAAARRGGLCLVASPDGRKGSLALDQDARVYSAMLDPGQHVVHELIATRGAWLHVIAGEVALGDVTLATGDGAAITTERAVSITARAATEILLFDLGDPSPLTSTGALP
jgi:redox-sensitive bicupin YhaK (pirin superfamily)